MSDRMEITSSESGMIRLFSIDLPKEAIERFTTQAGTGEYPLQYALGASQLRNDFVDVVAIKDLGEMALSDYLAQAYDVTGQDFKQAKARIDALNGHVLILPSQAFAKTAQSLTIRHPLHWAGTFSERQGAGSRGKIRSKSAKGLASSGMGTNSGKTAGRLSATGLAIAVILILAVAFVVFALS